MAPPELIQLSHSMLLWFASMDSLGGGTVAGDLRWTGSYGVRADILARTHCSVDLITTEDIKVLHHCGAVLKFTGSKPFNMLLS